MYFQGEKDANKLSDAQAYSTRFHSMLTTARQQLSMYTANPGDLNDLAVVMAVMEASVRRSHLAYIDEVRAQQLRLSEPNLYKADMEVRWVVRALDVCALTRVYK